MEAGQDDIALNIDEDDDFVVVTPVQPMESGNIMHSVEITGFFCHPDFT